MHQMQARELGSNNQREAPTSQAKSIEYNLAQRVDVEICI